MQLNARVYQAGINITPSDTVYQQGRSLWVGGAGNLSIVGLDGITYTMAAVPAGSLIYNEFLRINATGTTATLLAALY